MLFVVFPWGLHPHGAYVVRIMDTANGLRYMVKGTAWLRSRQRTGCMTAETKRPGEAGPE